MGMHESITDAAKQDGSKVEAKAKAQPLGNDATSKPAGEDDSRAAEATKAALATIEAIKVEAPMMALASIEAPKLAPSLDMPMLDAPKLDLPKDEEIKPPHEHAADADTASHAAAADTNDSEPQPRVSRFTLLAASLVLCAAFGAMIGALVAAGITRPMPVASIAMPTERANIEDINALKEQIVQARVDLAALKSSIDAGNRNANAQFSRIGERVERMERVQAEPVAKLGKAIEALERRADHAKTAREATGSITPPQPIVGATKDASRAGIVEGWVLRDVERGTAIIEGRMGLVEVDQGDVVPGVGRVEAIRKQDGRWVVVTPKGLIVPAR